MKGAVSGSAENCRTATFSEVKLGCLEYPSLDRMVSIWAGGRWSAFFSGSVQDAVVHLQLETSPF